MSLLNREVIAIRDGHSLLQHPRFLARVGELSLASDAVWFAALLTGIVITLIAARLFARSLNGLFWVYAALLIRASLYLWAGETLRGRGGEAVECLFRLGLVAGLFELLVDWGLIHWVASGKLVYLKNNDVVLLGSPVWMPLAWACVVVEIGYPCLRMFGFLSRRWSRWVAGVVASGISATGAALTVGFYEYFTTHSGLWKYEPARMMLGNFCALYIILGEFFMFLVLLPIAARALAQENRPMAAAVSGGAQFACAIAVGYTLAYFLLEGGTALH